MRWPDETYVKLYTRDTPTWKALTWEGRALLPLLMRKLDKAGLLECGQLGRAAVGLMVEMPEAVVIAGLGSLERLGVVVWHGNTLEMPKFEDAQEARASDLQRKREQRARAKDAAKAEAIAQLRENSPVDVTRGHAVSHEVTPRHNSPDTTDSPDKKKETSAAPPGLSVFEHWAKVMGKTGAKFKGKRQKRVADRLKDGYTQAQLCMAVDGCALTPFNMGQNDSGQRYDDLELICRDVERVDRFIRHATAPPTRAGSARFANAQDSNHANATPGVVSDF